MSQHQSTQPTSLCSWPPSPALLSLQLLARGIVVLTDIIGLSLLFAVSTAYDVADRSAAVVGGSFLVVSLALTPLIMLWNGRLLKRVKKWQNQQQQSQDMDTSPPRFKTKALRLVTVLDGVGALAFFIVFFPVINGATGGDPWWNTNAPDRVIYAYGSVSVLCAVVIHFFLFMTQALQLHSASCMRKDKKMVCPHCNQTMARVSTSDDYKTPPESMVAEHSDPMLVDSLVDTRISMNPGQETGTTFKTPRQSEHQSRATAPAQAPSAPQGEANETGEGEQDALISKTG